MKVKIGLTIEPKLLAEIDRLRGITKRSTFVEHLLKIGLQAYKKQNPPNNPQQKRRNPKP
jgi:metal-responsive CopG/Arc/MetJ family transcriptional regulator